MSETRLSVNVNKVALVRNSRGGEVPDLVKVVEHILMTGAYGITVHPRPDERHVRFDDVMKIRQLILEKFPDREFNIEGNPFNINTSNSVKVSKVDSERNSYPGYMEMVLTYLPHQATLVPDESHQLTSDHGWDLEKNARQLEPLIKQLKDKKIRVSLFLDVDCSSLKIAREIGCDRVELFTEEYAKFYHTSRKDEVLKKYIDQAAKIKEIGLEINAGHDLDLQNLGYFVKKIPHLKEVSIGHALVSESLFRGLSATVSAYLEVLKQ